MATIPPEAPTLERLRRLGSKTMCLRRCEMADIRPPFNATLGIFFSFSLHHAARFDPST